VPPGTPNAVKAQTKTVKKKEVFITCHFLNIAYLVVLSLQFSKIYAQLQNCSFITLTFILYPCGVGAQGDAYTATICDLFASPLDFLIISDSSTRALWHGPADISSSEAGEHGEEKVDEFCLRSISFMLVAKRLPNTNF
jgi:hypothetical protein